MLDGNGLRACVGVHGVLGVLARQLDLNIAIWWVVIIRQRGLYIAILATPDLNIAILATPDLNIATTRDDKDIHYRIP
jgi:hypothetical protein